MNVKVIDRAIQRVQNNGLAALHAVEAEDRGAGLVNKYGKPMPIASTGLA